MVIWFLLNIKIDLNKFIIIIVVAVVVVVVVVAVSLKTVVLLAVTRF
jgi:hypothetical protein